MVTFKYGGKKGYEFKMIEAEDLIVVRSTKSADLRSMNLTAASRSLVAGLIPVMTFPEVNVAVYRLPGTSGEESILKLRNSIRKQLRNEDQIRFAGRTLINSETGKVMIYTENIFIKFKKNISEKLCNEIIQSHGLDIKMKYTFADNAYFLKPPEGTGLKTFEIANALLELAEVESCHPEIVTKRREKSVHPMQWHLRRTTINNIEINQHVNINEAWEITKGAGITISIIDNGVDSKHRAFSEPGKIVGQFNALNGTKNTEPLGNVHGTACAGLACANAPNNTKGVAPEARLMPIVFSALGSLTEARAIQWAADNGADIISCSWGPEDGPWWEPGYNNNGIKQVIPDSTRYAIDYAASRGRNGKGCVIVWAAGNGNESVDYDGYASYDKVIAVAACNDRGRRSVYSDFGRAIWCCFPSNDFGDANLMHPDPLTPGIWTTDISGRGGDNDGSNNDDLNVGDKKGDYISTFGGTSSACPGVAGLAALILSANPDLNRDQVKNIIKNTCDKIDAESRSYNAQGHSPLYGYGRVNAGKAVKLAQQYRDKEFIQPINGSFKFGNEIIDCKPDIWMSSKSLNQRLWSFNLYFDAQQYGIGVNYQIFTSGGEKHTNGSNGQAVYLTDKRRKITGVKIELTSSKPLPFEIQYAVKFAGIDGYAVCSGGQLCGDDTGKGPAIIAIMIELIKKS